MADGTEVGRGYITVTPKLANGSAKSYAKTLGDGLKGEGANIGDKLGSGMKSSGTKVGKAYGSSIFAAAKKYAAPIAGIFSVIAVKKFASECTSSFTSLAGSTKTLQRLMGGTASEVSQIAGAMRLSGMDTSKANASLTIFAKKITAAQSGTASAASAFSSLGVKLQDSNGKTKESGQLLEEVADKFAAMPDGATKTAAAVQLFGRSGTAMLPFLNKGSAGIEELKKKAEELGITIDEDGIKKWGAYRGAVREWQVAIDGAKVTLGEAFTPYITGAATVLTQTLVPAIQNISKTISEFFDGLSSAIDTEGFKEAFGGIGDAISSVFSSDKAGTAKSVGAAIGSAINGLIPVINAAKPLVSGIANAIKFLGQTSAISVPVITAVGTGILAMKAASTVSTAIKGVASGISSIAGRGAAAAGGLTATAAAETAAGTAGATSATQILAAAAAVVALGAGVALAGAGMWLIANAAIALASAGVGAIAVAGGLVLVIAGLAVGAAALGPALAVAAPGLVAFGAAILMIGAGIGIAAAGMALLASQTPILASYGLQGATALLALGAAALAASPGFLALAVSTLAVSVPMLLLGAGAILAGTGLLLAGVGATLLMVALPIISAQLPTVAAAFGALAVTAAAAAPSIVILGAASLILGTGLLLAGAGSVLLMAALPIIAMFSPLAATGLTTLATASVAAAPSIGILAAATLAAAIPMTLFAGAAMLAGVGLLLAGTGSVMLATSLPIITALTPIVAAAMNTLAQSSTSAAPSVLALAAAALAVSAPMAAFAATAILAGAGLVIAGAGITLLMIGLPIVAAMLPIVANAMNSLTTTAGLVAPAMLLFGAAVSGASVPMIAFAAGIVIAALGMSGFSAKSITAAAAVVMLAANLPRVTAAAPIAATAISAFGAMLAAAAQSIQSGTEPIKRLAENMDVLDGASCDAAGSLGKISRYAAILAAAFRIISSTSVTTATSISMVGATSAPAFKKLALEAKSNIENAEKTIRENVKKIKDTITNVELKFPQIDVGKLPHYRWEGDFDAKTNKVKKLKVDWYRKGGIFDSASLIGVGEAGSEAVLPLNKRSYAMMGEGIVDGLPENDHSSDEVLALLRQIADILPSALTLDGKKVSSNVNNRLGRRASLAYAKGV